MKRKKIFNIILLISLVTTGFLVYEKIERLEYVKSQNIDFFLELCKTININNMVTSVYLGPRIFDTFLEALVVIATAMSLNYLWRKK
ncbi:MAG: hypothetical protein WC002_08690 [Candidatus Muiribacteriota bacterium]